MSKQSAAQREDITFEQGYEELKSIVARLSEEDVSVHEMFEGFRRGKGLEQALRGYLSEREGELSEIEQGGNLPEFNIVAPSAPENGRGSESASLGDELLASEPTVKKSPPRAVIDEEIPF